MSFHQRKTDRQLDHKKLAKVLALTASQQDGEAIAALRMAQRLLHSAGFSLEDMAGEVLLDQDFTLPRSQSFDETTILKAALDKTQAKLDAKTEEAAKQASLAHELSRQVASLEQALARQKSIAEGWRQRAWRLMWRHQRTD